MKTFFIIVLFFIIVIIIGLFVFLATFDANKYKDLLVEKIEETIDKDVRMGDISLNFFPGIALRIDEFSLKDRDKTWGDAILDAEAINAGIKLFPLLKKDVQLQHLNIKELNLNITKDFRPLVKPVFRDIELKGAIKEKDMVIQRLTGLVAGGYFSIKGFIKDIGAKQDLEFNITLKDINVGEFLPVLEPDNPQLEGSLSANMQCSASGLDGQKILNTFSAKGVAKLDKATLNNINVLSLALDKLNTILPDLVSRLKEQLPQRYSELLKQDFTAFRPIEVDFNTENDKICFQKTKIESDAFYMVGSGYVSIAGDLEINANFFIPQDLSTMFVSEVYELKYLANNQGMITMPLKITGRIPSVSVRPDLDYVMERLAIATGEQLIRSIFIKERTSESQGGSSGEAQDQKEQEKVQPEEILIKTIFDIIGGPKSKDTGGDNQ